MTEDLLVPSHYIVGSKADAEKVQQVLRITPCVAAVVSQHSDVAFAQQFVTDVLLNADPLDVIKETHSPCLVVGDGNNLEAIYEGGRRERIA